MALGVLALCVGVAVKLVGDLGWSLILGGVVTALVGAGVAQGADQRDGTSSTTT